MTPQTSPPRDKAGASLSHAWHSLLSRTAWVFGGSYGRAPATPATPDEELTIDAGDVSLRALHWRGNGVPLVLLHGLNNNAWAWARVASQLRRSRRVVAVSQRGHGGSTAPEHGYELEATTRDLISLMDQLSLERVHLGGHSWGGKVACHVAATIPKRVSSLILADPAPPKDLNKVLRGLPSWLIEAPFRSERGPFRSRAQWEQAMLEVPYQRIGDDTDRALWSASYAEHDDGSMHHCLPDSAFQEILGQTLAQDIRPMTRDIACPALLMLPTFTLSFLPGEVRALRDALPRVAVVRVPGDHTFIHTNAIDTAAAISRFLDTV